MAAEGLGRASENGVSRRRRLEGRGDAKRCIFSGIPQSGASQREKGCLWGRHAIECRDVGRVQELKLGCASECGGGLSECGGWAGESARVGERETRVTSRMGALIGGKGPPQPLSLDCSPSPSLPLLSATALSPLLSHPSSHTLLSPPALSTPALCHCSLPLL